MEACSSTDKGARIVGIVGILVGVFAIVALVALFYIVSLGPKPTPAQELSFFNDNQSANELFAAGVTLLGTFVIAFAGGFSAIVRKTSSSISSAAALLVAAGALILVIGDDLEVGSLIAITQAPSTAAYATYATYFAAVVSNFTDVLSTLEFSIMGIGLLLFAWTIWKDEMFPRWLSYVLLIGGVLGILSVIPATQFFVLGAAIFVGVWGFGAGGVLLRTKSAVAEPAN